MFMVQMMVHDYLRNFIRNNLDIVSLQNVVALYFETPRNVLRLRMQIYFTYYHFLCRINSNCMEDDSHRFFFRIFQASAKFHTLSWRTERVDCWLLNPLPDTITDNIFASKVKTWAQSQDLSSPSAAKSSPGSAAKTCRDGAAKSTPTGAEQEALRIPSRSTVHWMTNELNLNELEYGYNYHGKTMILWFSGSILRLCQPNWQ